MQDPFGAISRLDGFDSSLRRFTSSAANNGKEIVKRVKGIEPSLSAWKAVALPLSYTRKLCDKKTGKSDDYYRPFYAVALFAKQTSA